MKKPVMEQIKNRKANSRLECNKDFVGSRFEYNFQINQKFFSSFYNAKTLCLGFLLVLLFSCSKERKVTKHFEGVWIATEIVKNGEPTDMTKLRMELDFFSNTTVKYTAYAEFRKEEELPTGVEEVQHDVEIVASEDAKFLTFRHKFGLPNEFIEEFEIIKLKRKKMVLKLLNEENYFTFEKLKEYND